MGRLKDLTGQRFGKLVVLHLSDHKSNAGKTLFDCLCDCGKVKTISSTHLVSGHTTSCGCYLGEWCVKTKTTHGMKHTKIYGVYHNMMRRCNEVTNVAYRLYGARGIAVCEEWAIDPVAFFTWAKISGYIEGLTLDRIDNNGPYSPENCRWVTQKEQSRNTRQNVNVSMFGKTQCLSDTCAMLNIKFSCVQERLRKRHSIACALLFPLAEAPTSKETKMMTAFAIRKRQLNAMKY